MRVSAPFRFGSMAAKPPLTMRGMRIGLLGGSFDPPHAGHVQTSETALRRLGLDQVWWLVTPGNVLKSRTDLAPLDDRLALCRNLARNPRIVPTAFEAALPSRYTAATVAFLLRRNPGVHFVWLMGADCLADFHRWMHWREIMTTIPVAVVDRPGQHLRAMAGRASSTYARWRLPEARARLIPSARAPAWTLITGPLSPLSSTAIRATSSFAEPGRMAQSISRD